MIAESESPSSWRVGAGRDGGGGDAGRAGGETGRATSSKFGLILPGRGAPSREGSRPGFNVGSRR